MRARESQLASALFGRDRGKITPVVREGGSDSATFDNVLELLMLAGRSLPHAVMMMIPEASAGRGARPPPPQGDPPSPRPLVPAGRSLPHAVMMMIPEAYAGREDLPQHLKGFYAFHSCFMEPWDGPAAVCFTDGTVVGATLDRNGLRPGRWGGAHGGHVLLGAGGSGERC